MTRVPEVASHTRIIYSIQASAAIKATPPYITPTLEAPPVKVAIGGLGTVTVPLLAGEGAAETLELVHVVTVTTVVAAAA